MLITVKCKMVDIVMVCNHNVLRCYMKVHTDTDTDADKSIF